MKRTLLVTIIILGLSLAAKGESDSSYTFDSEKSRLVIDIGYMYNNTSQIFNLSFNVVNHSHNDKLEHGFSFFPNSLVKRDPKDTWRYSFQTPVNLSVLLIRLGIQKIFCPDRTESFVYDPGTIDFILFSPNSSIKYKLSPQFSIGLRTNTDYFFVRLDGLDRGILFTPGIELTYYPGGNNVDHGAYTLSVTNSSFINFEGDNNNDGVGIRLSLYVNPLFN